jgi:hypothetical protein
MEIFEIFTDLSPVESVLGDGHRGVNCQPEKD